MCWGFPEVFGWILSWECARRGSPRSTENSSERHRSSYWWSRRSLLKIPDTQQRCQKVSPLGIGALYLYSQVFSRPTYSALNGDPQNRYVYILTIKTCEWDLIWQESFADVLKFKILRWDYPGISGWVLNPMASDFIRDRREDTETEEKAKKRWRHRSELCIPQPRDAWSYQKLEEAKKHSPLESPDGARLCLQPDGRHLASRIVRE